LPAAFFVFSPNFFGMVKMGNGDESKFTKFTKVIGAFLASPLKPQSKMVQLPLHNRIVLPMIRVSTKLGQPFLQAGITTQCHVRDTMTYKWAWIGIYNKTKDR
jgi:hypothetical protein